jgi:hypothetical protein
MLSLGETSPLCCNLLCFDYYNTYFYTPKTYVSCNIAVFIAVEGNSPLFLKAIIWLYYMQQYWNVEA